jgi:hypothetical protein
VTGSPRSRQRRRRYKRLVRCPACGGDEFTEAVDNYGFRYPGCVHCILTTGETPQPQSYLTTLSSPPRKMRGQ